MPNFPKLLRDFLMANPQNWTEQNPLFDDVEWPYMASRDYLLRPDRQGKCMIWMQLSQVRRLPVVKQFTEAWMTVNVNCYCRARTNSESDVTDAQQRVHNMADQISRIIQANFDQIDPAWLARPTSGERELVQFTDPLIYIVILPIQFWVED